MMTFIFYGIAFKIANNIKRYFINFTKKIEKSLPVVRYNDVNPTFQPHKTRTLQVFIIYGLCMTEKNNYLYFTKKRLNPNWSKPFFECVNCYLRGFSVFACVAMLLQGAIEISAFLRFNRSIVRITFRGERLWNRRRQ